MSWLSDYQDLQVQWSMERMSPVVCDYKFESMWFLNYTSCCPCYSLGIIKQALQEQQEFP